MVQTSLPEQSLPSAMHLQSVMKHYGGERAARVSVHVHGHNTHLKFSRKPQLLDAGRSADVSYHADRPGRGQSTSLPQLHPHASPPVAERTMASPLCQPSHCSTAIEAAPRAASCERRLHGVTRRPWMRTSPAESSWPSSHGAPSRSRRV